MSISTLTENDHDERESFPFSSQQSDYRSYHIQDTRLTNRNHDTFTQPAVLPNPKSRKSLENVSEVPVDPRLYMLDSANATPFPDTGYQSYASPYHAGKSITSQNPRTPQNVSTNCVSVDDPTPSSNMDAIRQFGRATPTFDYERIVGIGVNERISIQSLPQGHLQAHYSDVSLPQPILHNYQNVMFQQDDPKTGMSPQIPPYQPNGRNSVCLNPLTQQGPQAKPCQSPAWNSPPQGYHQRFGSGPPEQRLLPTVSATPPLQSLPDSQTSFIPGTPLSGYCSMAPSQFQTAVKQEVEQVQYQPPKHHLASAFIETHPYTGLKIRSPTYLTPPEGQLCPIDVTHFRFDSIIHETVKHLLDLPKIYPRKAIYEDFDFEALEKILMMPGCRYCSLGDMGHESLLSGLAKLGFGVSNLEYHVFHEALRTKNKLLVPRDLYYCGVKGKLHPLVTNDILALREQAEQDGRRLLEMLAPFLAMESHSKDLRQRGRRRVSAKVLYEDADTLNSLHQTINIDSIPLQIEGANSVQQGRESFPARQDSNATGKQVQTATDREAITVQQLLNRKRTVTDASLSTESVSSDNKRPRPSIRR